MDVELFSKILKELLSDNDRVTLPGVGSFVSKSMPSTFSDRGYTINPPYKVLSFSLEQGSDSVLCDFYAHSNNVAQEVAAKVVGAFASEVERALSQQGELYFPSLGTLRKGRSGGIFFAADQDLELYPLGMALESVSLKARRYEGIADRVGNDTVPERIATQASNDADTAVIPSSMGNPLGDGTESEGIATQAGNDVPEACNDVKKGWKRFWIAMLVIFAVAAIVVGAFYILKIYFPDILDLLLYNKEELELIDYFRQ